MSHHFTDPNGDLFPVSGVQRVHLAEGKGVIAFDMRQRPLIWIEEKDVEKAKQARDVLIALVQSRGRTGQPDWSFLKKAKVQPKAA